MSKITKAFENKKTLIAFITGGDPDIETTKKLIITIAKAGADIIEIGIPFSDPVAEGPVIQAASERALQAGTTVDKLFDMIKNVRNQGVDIPLLFMTYANPIFVYGTDKFLSRSVESGINGLIVPDMPYEESRDFKELAKKSDIDFIDLVAPTSGDRIDFITKHSTGFVYCVSTTGVTGTRDSVAKEAKSVVDRVKKATKTPATLGFGISTPEQAKEVSQYAHGVIIGSAIVKIVAEHGKDCLPHVEKFIKDIRVAM